MKKLLFLIFLFLANIGINAQVSKIIGNSARNAITKAKIYDGKIYACGINQSNIFLPYATFSSFDLNGNLLSNAQIDTSSIPSDFEIITDEPGAAPAGFIMVGRTEPSVSLFNTPLDNASFTAEFDANGNSLNTKVYNASAREAFNSVVRTGFIPNVNFYIVGQVNNNNLTANTIDRGVIWKLGADRSVQNIWEYQQDSTLDSELGKKILNWKSGRLLTIGNRVDNNAVRYGIIYTINTNNGNVDQSVRLPENHLILDAYRLSTGDLLVSGMLHGTTTTFLTKLDKTTFASKWSILLNDLNSLQELGEDTNGLLYALGKDQQEYYIHSFKDNGTSASLLSSTTLSNGDSGFDFGNLFVRPSVNSLLYADARTISNGYGNQDILLGVYSHDLKTKCKSTKIFSTKSATIKPLGVKVLKVDLKIPDSIERKADKISYKSKDFCTNVVDTICSCDNLIIKPLPTTVPLNCKGLYSIDAGKCFINKIEVIITNGSGTVNNIVHGSCTSSSSTNNSVTFSGLCSNVGPFEINFIGNGTIQYNIIVTLSNGKVCVYKNETQCSPPSCCSQISKLTQSKDCCSQIKIGGCEVKSINVQIPNGFIGGIDLQNCTDPVVPANTNNFTISNCITPQTVTVCTKQPSTAQQMYVNYVVTFFSGEVCTIKDTIKCSTAAKPCVEAFKKDVVCGAIVNNQQTYNVSGLVNNGTAFTTNLGVNVIGGGGTISNLSPATVPPNATNVPVTFSYTTATNTNPCFIVSLSTPTFLCRDTICYKLPTCPPLPDDCCQDLKVDYSTCFPHDLIIGTYTLPVQQCINTMKIEWSGAINPVGNLTYTSPSGSNSTNFPTNSPYDLNMANLVISNLNFTFAAASGATGSVTVTMVLCDGTICKKTYPWNPNGTGGGSGNGTINQEIPNVEKIFLASFSIDDKSNKKPKYIAVGFADKGEIAILKPNIIAVTGGKHSLDALDSTVVQFESAKNSKLNAFFELSEKGFKGKKFSIVYSAEKPNLLLGYVLFDENGNQIGKGKIALEAKKVVTKIQDLQRNETEKVLLFPNPTSQDLKVTYSTSESMNIKLEVYDVLGRAVGISQNEFSSVGTNEYSLNVSTLTNGFYVLKISSKNGVNSYRFQVVK